MDLVVLVAVRTDNGRTEADARLIDQAQTTAIACKTFIMIGVIFVVGERLHFFNGFVTFGTLMQLYGLITWKFLFTVAVTLRTRKHKKERDRHMSMSKSILPTTADSHGARRIVHLHWSSNCMTSKRSTQDDILDLCITCIECRTRSHCHIVYNAWIHVCDTVHKWNLPRSDRNCRSTDFGIWRISDNFDDKFYRWRSCALPSEQSFGHTHRIDRRNGALSFGLVSAVYQKNDVCIYVLRL